MVKTKTCVCAFPSLQHAERESTGREGDLKGRSLVYSYTGKEKHLLVVILSLWTQFFVYLHIDAYFAKQKFLKVQ